MRSWLKRILPSTGTVDSGPMSTLVKPSTARSVQGLPISPVSPEAKKTMAMPATTWLSRIVTTMKAKRAETAKPAAMAPSVPSASTPPDSM